MVIVLNYYHVSSCLGFNLGFRFLQLETLESHGLPLALLSRLRLSFYALIFARLRQSLSYMLCYG